MLFEILELPNFDSLVKGNILIAVGDLYKRFTNTLESKNEKFFSCLHDPKSHVWRHCFRVISHLALNDMIKIRGEISDICLLLKDEDIKIQDLVKLFLHEIHSKNKETIF